MQRDLFGLPFIVGSHYFMWCDEPALGISKTFPEDSNYGLVSESDKPYALLTETAARVNAQMADLHAGRIRREDISPGTCPRATGSCAARRGRVAVSADRCRLHGRDGAFAAGQGYGQRKAVRSRRLAATARDAWTELGCYEAVLQIKTSEGNGWPHADRVTGSVSFARSRDDWSWKSSVPAMRRQRGRPPIAWNSSRGGHGSARASRGWKTPATAHGGWPLTIIT